jgi:redox-sensing transcriptional repressor
VTSQDRVVTLLSRPGCHLCDQAREVVTRVTADLGVAWEERDITTSEGDLAEYWDKIPVTLIDGAVHDFWHVSEQRLRQALRSELPGSPAAGRRAGGDPCPAGHQPPQDQLCANVHKGVPWEASSYVSGRTARRVRLPPRPLQEHRRMSRGPSAPRGSQGIPEATIARLPVYLRVLYACAEQGIATVSSEELAAAAGVNSAKLRKDLSHLGSYGTRGVGYDVDYLVYQVSRELGLTQDWPVVIVGAGNLGRALANYGGFATRGFRIAAVLDVDPAVVGTEIAAGHVVGDAGQMEAVVDRHAVSIGVIATPARAAQGVCDRLVTAGVTSILNFAPVVLSVPAGVDVRKVDLSIELQILAFHAQRRSVVRVAKDGSKRRYPSNSDLTTFPPAPVPGEPPVPGTSSAITGESAVAAP